MLNSLSQLSGQTTDTLNAWSIVALGFGAFLAHAYHTIVNSGGLKRLWSNFWNGPSNSANQVASTPASNNLSQSPAKNPSIPSSTNPS